jgi:cholesterol oxidase
MPPLASTIGDLKSHYDVIVVGSGYGGAIAARRLAGLRLTMGKHRRPMRLCVLERGREFQAGDFPTTPLQAMRQVQLDFPSRKLGSNVGLYDFRINRDVSVLVGCGLGGTSLINANVLLKPTDSVLDDPCWPAAIRDDPLFRSEAEDGYFARAQSGLDASRYPGRWPVLTKHEVLRESTRRVVGQPLLAISFQTRLTSDGVQHEACTLCGDCVSGCNHGAKNTVNKNYLAEAHALGAEIYCQVDVRSIEQRKSGWLVWLRPVGDARRPELFIRADTVILAAGTLGSTEILLRSRERGLSLSRRLGSGFTGNGDVVALGYNNDKPVRAVGFGAKPPAEPAPVGPTISGFIDERDSASGLLIEEGALPRALANMLRWFMPLISRFSGSDTDRGIADRLRELGRELRMLVRGPRQGALQHTQVYLVMGSEQGSGIMHLPTSHDRLRIKWPGVGSQQLFRTAAARLREMTRGSGGTNVRNPFWTRLLGRRLLTVHPLGGCGLGTHAGNGVVNAHGQVFSGTRGTAAYPNLYVCDGSVIPRPLGSNPLWTICALAERMCHLLIQRQTDAKRWDEPAARVPAPTRLNTPPSIGIRFNEKMVGFFDPTGTAPRSRLELNLSIESADLAKLLSEEPHRASVVGTARAPALDHRQLSITESSFELFTRDIQCVDTRHMRYRLKLVSANGRVFFLSGQKTVGRDTTIWNVWRVLTRLPYGIVDEDSHPVGQGELRLGAFQVVKSFVAGRITNRRRLRDGFTTRLRFVRYFLDVPFQAVLWPFRRAIVIDPYATRTVENIRTPVRCNRQIEPTDHPVTTRDGAQIRLTHYSGDGQPVILAPGFGTSTLLFRLPTIEQNLVEALLQAGYDVWLLDYRASERSRNSATRFSLDDIAEFDFPAAVQHVHAVTKGKDVQFLGHCVASVALLMSLLSGRLSGVKSAICSQFFSHLVMPWPNRFKAWAHLGEVLDFVGYGPILTSDVDRYSPWRFRLSDRLLHFYPSEERCHSPVCRQTLFLYGEVFRHDLLNPETHDAVYDLFDRANLTGLRHLTRIIRARRAVSASGRNVYVDASMARANLRLPITLLQGERNGLFLPEGARETLSWLKTHGPYPAAYSIRQIPKYGHMDLFMGRDSHRDVFPIILEELERGQKMAEALKAAAEKVSAVAARSGSPV